MTAAAPTSSRKWKRWLLLLLPYIVGIAWTCVHPVLSVITGEAKCRGWFLDESSLETGSLRVDGKYSLATGDKRQGCTSLCDSISSKNEVGDAVDCFQHPDGFQVAKIVPVSGGVQPAETLVLVVPAPPTDSSWTTNDFHYGILQLMAHLSSPRSCPWLAKNVLIVSPSRNDLDLHSTVSLFVDSYLGSTNNNVSSLPMDFSFSILRNLLVFDVNVNETDTTSGNEVRILPQGRNGVLPNMDLVFATMSLYSRASFLRTSNANMIMHSYSDTVKKWKDTLPSPLSPFAQQWALELGSMFLFMYHLVVGPELPHAVALDKGIDSLTIQVDLYGPNARSHAVESVQTLQVVLRALSNLHERLHHSITQYLLPSPTKFVSHAEYLIPNLLLLLPLVIRAVTLVLFDIQRFDFRALQTVLVVGLVSGVLSVIALRTNNTSIMNALYAIIYISLCFGGISTVSPTKDQRKTYAQSLQFAICLVAIYMHVPLVLGHVSLAFPSALVWTVAIAFPSFPIPGTLWQRIKKPVVQLFVLLSLVSTTNWVFGRYTLFVTTVFMPLHILVTILWLI